MVSEDETPVEEAKGKAKGKAVEEEPAQEEIAQETGGDVGEAKKHKAQDKGDDAVKKKRKAKASEEEAAAEHVPSNEDDKADSTEAGEKIVGETEDDKKLKEKIIKELKEKRTKPAASEAGEAEVFWKPRTQLGLKVNNGELKTMEEVMKQSSPIKEVELVDKLLPELQEEILDVGRVQRVTDSGRRMRFRVVAAVGNGNGYVGVGQSKGKEAGPTIRKSIERAKLNITGVKRGCGSWECVCGGPHTVPFKVTGKAGSVTVILKPAPRGVGIVSGEIAKTILSLAGIKDVWVTTQGHSRTGINFAHAVIKALESTNYVKLREGDGEKLHMVVGQVKKADEVEVTA
jgi:small subunit ribosomal protein S5